MAIQDDMHRTRPEAARFTYADYVNFPDDGRRHELIDGEHFVTPSPEFRHQQLSSRLEFALGLYLRNHPIGGIYHAPLDVILSDVDVVEPDVLYVSNERSAILGKWVHGAPDLVVEILSPATRKLDESVKQRLYDRVGVKEYWILDPDLKLVDVFRRERTEGLSHIARLTLQAEAALSTPLLPGFEMPLAELFA